MTSITSSPHRCRRAAALCGMLALLLRSDDPRAAVLPHGFTDSVVVVGLGQPTGMAWLPDGRLLIIEQKTANLRVVVQDTVGPAIFTVPEVNGDGLERGLLGIAVDPAFPERPYVYVYLSHAGEPPTNHVVRYTLTGDLADPASGALGVDPASGVPLLTDIPDQASNHNAGTLRFGPDGLLYVSLGDDAARCAAQDPSLLRGALLRLDVSGVGTEPPAKSGLVPAGNPFTGPDDNARLVIAYGLRNPFRFQIDPLTGRVLIGDVGESAFEEVDVLEPTALGQDFGWPLREGPSATGAICPGIADTGTFVGPIAFYDRSIPGLASVITAGVYRGVRYPADRSFPPEYEGDAFFSDYYAGFLRRLHRNEDGTWAPAPAAPGQPSPTDWAQGIGTAADYSLGPDGALYYLSQFGVTGGSLHRIAFTPDVVLRTGAVQGLPDTDVSVPVRTSAAIGLGSTDVRLRFDPASLEATGVTSVLEGFDFSIDNTAGTVTTASASAAGQLFAAADALFSVAFHVRATGPGCSALTIEDADGTPPDDLAGPLPPIPPRTVLYTAEAGTFCVPGCGNGLVELGEDCDDNNQTPGDCCDATCHFETEGSACPDAPCTVGRTCDGAGACAGGTIRSCDDSNLCTDDGCTVATGCTHTNNTVPCDDGNACTTLDACAGGTCTGGTPRDCADPNPCTDDTCVPGEGCLHAPNTAPCSDDDACTVDDVCSNGTCTSGTPRACDDGNPCTVNRCEAGACAHPSAVDCGALGDTDCDGHATPIDAQVIRCLGLGRCSDADVPSPCDDSATRRGRTDWNLSGDLDGVDAASTVAIFVRRQRVADTALGACCPLSLP